LAKARLDRDDGRAGYGDGLFIPAVPVFSLDFLDPDAASFPQVVARLFDAAQKARVIFELIVAPFILGREAYQHAGWFSVAGNHDLLALGFTQSISTVERPRSNCFSFAIRVRLC
jgi:hypothetical protein